MTELGSPWGSLAALLGMAAVCLLPCRTFRRQRWL
jgi:Mg2+ and Co2+ transporter CorA